MAQRNSYNWSILDRTSLRGILNQARKFVVGKTLSVEDFHKTISATIKAYLPVRVTSNRDPKTKLGHVYVGGVYHSYFDKANQRQIEIIFSYHMFDKTIKLTAHKWNKICTLFADTVLHELIHMRQYRTRNFKTIPEYESTAQMAKQRRDQEYYGHADEIGAFSFNIACELYSKFGDNFNAAVEYLDNPSQIKKHKGFTYYSYLKAFDFNPKHKIIKKLKKKVIRNLPYAKIGKPFKTSDYLTY